MNIGHSKIDQHVEALCEHGCRAVLNYIEALHAGRELPEFAALNSIERGQLCIELEAIMAVYENRCRL